MPEEIKKYVDILVKGTPKKIAVAKISKWVCHECGNETFQPEGKVVENCEKCGTAHSFLIEPDGQVLEYVRAEGWFVKEFEEHNQHMAQVDLDFRNKSFQLVKLNKVVNDLVDRIEQGRIKMNNIIENGCRRQKLLKRQDMAWRYIPNIQRFMGVKKEGKK